MSLSKGFTSRLTRPLTSSIAVAAAALSIDFTLGAMPSIVTFSRATTATYFNSSGVLSTAAIDQPRFDYDPITLAAKGLLVEDTRTNLLLYSAQFSDASWVKQANVSVSAAAAPDGSMSAGAVLWPSAGIGAGIYKVGGFVNGAANTKSIWIRADVAGGAVQIVDPTMTVGTLTVILSTQWTRVTLSEVAGSQPGFSGIWVKKTVTSPSTVYIWGAQLEVGSFATSYIPTSASAVTRAADVTSITGSNFSALFNVGGAGTILMEASWFSPASANEYLFDTSVGERIFLYKTSPAKVAFGLYSSSAFSVSADGGTTAIAGNVVKTASAFATGDASVYLNGSQVVSSAAAVLPTPSSLILGWSASSSEHLNGHIRKFSYYKSRLAASQLQALTT